MVPALAAEEGVPARWGRRVRVLRRSAMEALSAEERKRDSGDEFRRGGERGTRKARRERIRRKKKRKRIEVGLVVKKSLLLLFRFIFLVFAL